MDRSRLESFSDGVFAVAITLLALNLAVDGPGHGSLLHQLGHHWPSFVAYVISFFTIGIIWVNHHALVNNIAIVDRPLLFLNLLLLAIVVAIPFVTATMADYLTAGGQDAHVAMALYAGTFELMGLGFTGPCPPRPGGRCAPGSTAARCPTLSPSAWPSSAPRPRSSSRPSSPSTTCSSGPRPPVGPRHPRG